MTHQLPPEAVAFVIDGEVVDVLHTEPRLAAILLSEPVMVRITDIFAEDPNTVKIGSKYDPVTKTFSN